MGKTSALSSDIDVIKEFEELKLKQKLLIESLKRNSDSQQNKLFLEINSKLDFLVKIFTESTSSDEEEEKFDFESKFNEVLDKISSVSKDVDEKFSQLDEKITSIQSKKEEVSNIKIEEPKLDVPVKLSEVSNKEKEKPQLPPAPNFETKIENVQKVEEKEKKKKKWF